jgi:prophage antirepressor-like protein
VADDKPVQLVIPALKTGAILRILGTQKNPLFNLADTARILGCVDVADTVTAWRARFDDAVLYFPDAVRKTPSVGSPATYNCYYVGEGIWYTILTTNRMPTAKPFQDWVCFEVLPSIRRHGCYPPPPAETEQRDHLLTVFEGMNELGLPGETVI